MRKSWSTYLRNSLLMLLDHLHVIFGAQLFVSWAIRVRPVHNYL